jgi:hypothetical protein
LKPKNDKTIPMISDVIPSFNMTTAGLPPKKRSMTDPGLRLHQRITGAR